MSDRPIAVRWGVNLTINGNRQRLIEGGGKPWARAEKHLAYDECTTWSRREPQSDPRIVKLTRKKKPRVAVRMIFQFTKGSGWKRDGQNFNEPLLAYVSQWMDDTGLKPVRLTLEELAE